MNVNSYTLDLLKKSAETLKFDRILEKALKNPALSVTSNAFLDFFLSNSEWFQKFFSIASKEIWEDPTKLNFASIAMTSEGLSMLQSSVADIEERTTAQHVFVALAFASLRRRLTRKQHKNFEIQKDIPLVYNFTFNSSNSQYDERKTLQFYGQRESYSKNLKWEGQVCPFFGYRESNQEVIRANESTIIYSESNLYESDEINPYYFVPSENSDDNLLTSFYGTPSNEEVSSIVKNAKNNLSKILVAKTECQFEISEEKQKKILNNCDSISKICFVDEVDGNFLNNETIFKGALENPLCVTISEGTVDNPKNSINIPFSGFYAFLQIALNLKRTKFSVKYVDEKTIIDFSSVKEKTTSNWVINENGFLNLLFFFRNTIFIYHPI
jgi:hypothetical protein